MTDWIQKNGKKVTALLILSTILLWILWDVPVAIWGDGATESEVLRDWASAWPSFAYGLGILAGHWFWNVDELPDPPIKRVFMAVAAVTSILVWMALDLIHGTVQTNPIFPFLIGILVGRVLWPLPQVFDKLE